MGFTIAGNRDGRAGSRRVRSAAGARAATTAAVREYASYGWDVVPGARSVRSAGTLTCSCAVPTCLQPGDHPLRYAAAVPGGATAQEAEALWSQTPDAAVLLPAGRAFDVLDVPEAPGRAALCRLERMALPPGPVALTPTGRVRFLVAPGAVEGLAGLLYRMGWDGAELDLRPLGRGDHVMAPPSGVDGVGPVRWLRAPTPATAHRPPEARLLLGTLAYLCHVGPMGRGRWADDAWQARALPEAVR
ncbi:bifunctional DNA primase/polymerase [Streptomyces sp. NPDC059740]|uniref:bifunctional DNA primase/polymerase n=1 Tax=Streptomyces sp. NPDC059740 TaxID=3346926 RepID=UPI00365EC780